MLARVACLLTNRIDAPWSESVNAMGGVFAVRRTCIQYQDPNVYVLNAYSTSCVITIFLFYSMGFKSESTLSKDTYFVYR